MADRAFRYGDGLFETVRAYGSAPHRLGEHLGRLRASMLALGYEAPDDVLEGTVGDVASLLRDAGSSDAAVRIVVSRGDGGPFETTGEPWRLVDVEAIETAAVRPAVTLARIDGAHTPGDLFRAHKSTSFLRAIWARREAVRLGATEALYVSADGLVGEASTANVFASFDGLLVTPPLDGIVPGIVRSDVISVARTEGMIVAERPLRVTEIAEADEIFLTSSLAELVPATMLDGRPVGTGAPGPVWATLLARYRDLSPR